MTFPSITVKRPETFVDRVAILYGIRAKIEKLNESIKPHEEELSRIEKAIENTNPVSETTFTNLTTAQNKIDHLDVQIKELQKREEEVQSKLLYELRVLKGKKVSVIYRFKDQNDRPKERIYTAWIDGDIVNVESPEP